MRGSFVNERMGDGVQKLTQHERRYRLLYITPELLLAVMFSPRLLSGVVCAHHLDGLPEDVVVQAVAYSEERHAFMLRLYHPSFSVSEGCCTIPEISPQVSVVDARVMPEQQGREFI